MIVSVELTCAQGSSQLNPIAAGGADGGSKQHVVQGDADEVELSEKQCS